ncbi:hypothetical protein HanHA300_Chr06g0209011 [Helianthus annuus]|nr:hypothetical protein HanHA300_Chr06g0209011 [Helianthus annuus]
METLVHNFRLDAQEQRIKQLQGDVAEIKTTLKALEEHRAESREFRKVFLAWIQHQETRSDDSLSGSGSPSFFPNPSSDLQLEYVVDRHSDSPPNPPPSSLLEQLESIIARSEERLGKSLLHTGCGSKSRPESVNWAFSTAENTFVHDQFEEASDDHGHLLRNIHSDSSFSGGSADPLFRSPSLPSSPSLCIQLKNIMSRCEENLCSHGRLMSHSVNGLLLDNLQGMLGSEPLVGHNGELKTVVDLDYPDPGQGVEQQMVGNIDVLYAVGAGGLGLSLVLIHIYVTEIKRTLQALWVLGVVGSVAAKVCLAHDESLVQYVVDNPVAVWFVGPLFAALTGLVFKEGLCYGKLEAGILTFIIPSVLLGHLSGLMDDGVKVGLLGAWMTLFVIFAARKFTQPIKDDIGDKSVFTFKALPEEEKKALIQKLEQQNLSES